MAHLRRFSADGINTILQDIFPVGVTEKFPSPSREMTIPLPSQWGIGWAATWCCPVSPGKGLGNLTHSSAVPASSRGWMVSGAFGGCIHCQKQHTVADTWEGVGESHHQVFCSIFIWRKKNVSWIPWAVCHMEMRNENLVVEIKPFLPFCLSILAAR